MPCIIYREIRLPDRISKKVNQKKGIGKSQLMLTRAYAESQQNNCIELNNGIDFTREGYTVRNEKAKVKCKWQGN
jgi:hypothetical protein